MDVGQLATSGWVERAQSSPHLDCRGLTLLRATAMLRGPMGLAWKSLMLLFLLPSVASATVVERLDLARLTGRAGEILVARVVRAASHWSEDGRRIVTDTLVEVVEDISGTQVGQQIVVRRLGGVVANIGQTVAGAAVMKTGEEVLLFCEKRGARRYVVGMLQGLYRLERDQRNELRFRRRKLQGVHFLRTTASVSDLPAGGESLPAFVERLKRMLGRCRRKPSSCR